MPNQATRHRRRERRKTLVVNAKVTTAQEIPVQEVPRPKSPQPEPYTGIPASQINRVFYTALNLHKTHVDAITVDNLIQATGTNLGPEIVGSILEGVLRLAPHDLTPGGLQARRERERAIHARAHARERAFVAAVKTYAPNAKDEAQQKLSRTLAGGGGGTPDILFEREVEVCGSPCRWIEYKSFFGYRKDPFVFGKNLSQLGGYRRALGPGMVVYALGFEKGLLDHRGVHFFREEEVVAWLRGRPPLVEEASEPVREECIFEELEVTEGARIERVDSFAGEMNW